MQTYDIAARLYDIRASLIRNDRAFIAPIISYPTSNSFFLDPKIVITREKPNGFNLKLAIGVLNLLPFSWRIRIIWRPRASKRYRR
jgi:hypothetical protein